MKPTLLLAVHGTRDPRGTATAHSLALKVAHTTGLPVRLAFADVLTPTVTDTAADLPGPLVVVPAFLTNGHHVRTDIPRQLARAGRADAAVTPGLGDHPALAEAAAHRLHHAGHRPGDAVVMAAVGTRDPRALLELARHARALSHRLRTPVHIGHITTGTPTVPEQVAHLRARGHTRVSIASWLLAPGLFHQRLAAAGADTVAAPLCPHPAVARAVIDRYHSHLPAARS
ncbi:sirohydrochlorin chelatase [Nocardiopsis algeriensis]|uniref:sirohydrochlorin chelatase n=1 Tax=Nocardiopsis algeriensis TaxID=1478215 RepID=UPI003B42F026